MMRVCALISCMYKTDTRIIADSNIQSDVVVINQCDQNTVDRFTFINKNGELCNAIFVCTTERGLSRSRNMAIQFAPDDAICVVCDDDEFMADDYQDKIIKGYEDEPQCGAALFSLIRKDGTRRYPEVKYKLSFKDLFKANSLQITFKKNEIIKNNIHFDVKMGSGTGNGGGEENKFLLSCRRAGIKMYYFPYTIATVLPGESQWFSGFNEKFFENHGWASRRLLGSLLGFVYLCYSTMHLRYRYRRNLTSTKVFRAMIKGYFSRR